MSKPVSNRVLSAVPVDCLDDLRPHLEPVELNPYWVVYRADDPIDHIYFVESGLVCLVTTTPDGRSTAVGALGSEGLIGSFILYGAGRALWDYVVQIRGTAYQIEASILEQEMWRSTPIRRALDRAAYLRVSQLTHAAACNRVHTLAARTCQWLLRMHDAARRDTFRTTHEFLATILGVHRPGLSALMGELQAHRLVRYARGYIEILDRGGLEACACACYGTLRADIDETLPLLPGAQMEWEAENVISFSSYARERHPLRPR